MSEEARSDSDEADVNLMASTSERKGFLVPDEEEADIQERYQLVLQQREDLSNQVHLLRRQLDKLDNYKLSLEEINEMLRVRYDNLQRDYEETMQERSIVLEENARLVEERDKLKAKLMNIDTFEVESLRKKLEHTRRLLQVNMEETVNANASKDAALAKLNEAEKRGIMLSEQRDEAVRKCQQQQSGEAVVDVWNTYSVQISLPFSKSNLGIVLGGGRTDDGAQFHGPIYVKHVNSTSPFARELRALDHIMMVNGISVTDMDSRSVMGMLLNCHHIKLVIRRRSNANRIIDVRLPSTRNHPSGVGLELANGVFINSCVSNSAACKSGLAPGQRVVHVMNTPVYDAKHAEMLIKSATEPLIIGILTSGKNQAALKRDKHQSKLFSKLFGRPEKDRVVATANINSDALLMRQGSLRLPQVPTTTTLTSPLTRYGSLRATTVQQATPCASDVWWQNEPSNYSLSSLISSTVSPDPANIYRVSEEATYSNRRMFDPIIHDESYSSQTRLIKVARSCVRLCGGNAIGILAGRAIGLALNEGDLVLEIDGQCVRNTTLEAAVDLLNSRMNIDEMTQLLVADGGDRLNRLRLGADGDSFFLRVNFDKPPANKDDLELKAGDVVFVDKTMYMGKRGRWRAWRVDKEGRQREHGSIPSSSSIRQFHDVRNGYEFVERLNIHIKRPVVLFGIMLEPLHDFIIEENEQCTAAQREIINADEERIQSLFESNTIVEATAEKSENTFNVITSKSLIESANNGLHAIILSNNVAIVGRLQKIRLHPIVVKVRFKTGKQLKDVGEQLRSLKISSKQAKSCIEEDMKTEKSLEDVCGTLSLVVPNHNNASFMMSHAALQLKKIIEDEQKKAVWVPQDVDDSD